MISLNLIFNVVFLLVYCLCNKLTVALKGPYCDMPKCNERHIACGNEGGFGTCCPDNAQIVSIINYKDVILREFNNLRNKVAGGEFRNLQPAARMGTMSWDHELEYLAELNVNTCNVIRDKCRGTKRFVYSGQNIGMFSWQSDKNKYSHFRLIKDRLNVWFSEIENTTMNIINNFPDEQLDAAVGHFTVSVAEKNNFVGCAAISFKNDGYNRFLLTCNFATTNIVNEPIYTTSDTPGSACENGRNQLYNNLCSPNEIYENDKY